MKELKQFIEHELEMAQQYCKSREEMLNHCSFCLGALQYAMTIGQVTYEETVDWWDNEIREAFWHGEYNLNEKGV